MIFKDPNDQAQFLEMPDLLQEISFYFENLCEGFGIEPVVTRIKDPVEGDSGVHEAGRAIDFRDEYEGKRTFTDEQVKFIVEEMNLTYPRHDGKVVCIHHSFHGAPLHFHLQINVDQAKQESMGSGAAIV